MVVEVHCEGFDNFLSTVKGNEDKDVFVLFTGSVGADGNSWCPDCVVAEPVIKECLSALAEDSIFIHCSVGDRAYWKDQKNDFRTHDKLKLKGVPTLLKWGEQNRLVEEQCAKKDLVTMLFEED